MKAQQDKEFDLIIVGGGMAGLTLAAISVQEGLSVVLIDRQSIEETLSEKFDGRTTAISYGSSKILEQAGVWSKLEPLGQPITTIDVQDRHSPAILNFDATKVGDQPFGWILDNRDIRQQLYNVIKESNNMTLVAPAKIQSFKGMSSYAEVTVETSGNSKTLTLRGSLIAAADGRHSYIRTESDIDIIEYDYGQRAMVGTVIHEKPHNGLAVERFMPDGPFAILPMKDSKDGTHRSAMVWTMEAKGRHFDKISDELFQLELERRFDNRYGAVHWSGPKMVYPLSLYHAKQMIAPRIALIGDAAHAIHPIAGQGLNLGMQDIGCIANLLIEAKKDRSDLGSTTLLKQYQTERRPKVFQMVAATDLLNRLFSNDLSSVRVIRNIGLSAVNRIPPLKKFFMKTAMGE